MEQLFDNILDQDEKIIKVFKPHKGKLYLSTFLGCGIGFFIFSLIMALGILFPEEGYAVNILFIFLPIGIFVCSMLIVWLFVAIYYKNLFYAYSNKRIIIRSGIFGVDYKSLDMSMIGAVNVYVSLLDKLMRKNTGSITFGSTASPMVANQGGGQYKYSHITMPYETCKEIKFVIDQHKQNKAQ